MSPNSKRGKIGILVGGGPAPGINGVISAATIEARNNGYEVVGIPNGFEDIMEEDTSSVFALHIGEVSRIHSTGGSILKTSRANPTKKTVSGENSVARVIRSLESLGLTDLITIGGDDTAHTADVLSQALGGKIRIAHVPKTIDNDLPLPGLARTFGFETARHHGVNIARNLMTDAQTTGRWYFVVAMGRSTGHLTLGIGKAAGTTSIVIPEEFGRDPTQTISLERIADIVETTMYKRMTHGRPYGVILLAEGLGGRLDTEELQSATYDGTELDEHGNIRLAEIDFGRVLRHELLQRFKKREKQITIVNKNLGYELRCAPPVPFDMEYTRDLGFWAVRYIIGAKPSDPHGAMITIDQDKLRPMAFEDFRDSITGRPVIRYVDIEGEAYQVARKYMIRLERSDVEDENQLKKLAEAMGGTPSDFRKQFGYLVK